MTPAGNEAVSPQVRDRILELWARTRIDWTFARGLHGAISALSGIGQRERQDIAAAVFGLVRHIRRVDAALAAGGMRTTVRADDHARLIAYWVLTDELTIEQAAARFPAIHWQRVRDFDAEQSEVRGVRGVAIRHSLPDWLADELAASVGDELREAAAALNERAPVCLRANTLRGSRDELRARLTDRGIACADGTYARDALVLGDRIAPRDLSSFRDSFAVQDEASQLVAELVAAPPRGLVVDLCAGAGGKTLALAAHMANTGRIMAVDVDGRKLQELRRRCRDAGVTNVQTVLVRGDTLPPALAKVEGLVDRVLVDAPCSATGTLRRSPADKWRYGLADIQRFAEQQRRLVERAGALLAEDGRLVYAVCSFVREEGAGVVDGAAGLKPLPAADQLPNCPQSMFAEAGRYLATFPHRHGCDGFFAAVLARPVC